MNSLRSTLMLAGLLLGGMLATSAGAQPQRQCLELHYPKVACLRRINAGFDVPKCCDKYKPVIVTFAPTPTPPNHVYVPISFVAPVVAPLGGASGESGDSGNSSAGHQAYIPLPESAGTKGPAPAPIDDIAVKTEMPVSMPLPLTGSGKGFVRRAVADDYKEPPPVRAPVKVVIDGYKAPPPVKSPVKIVIDDFKQSTPPVKSPVPAVNPAVGAPLLDEKVAVPATSPNHILMPPHYPADLAYNPPANGN